MTSTLSGTSLGDYGRRIYEKYHFTCVYCGFDGRNFDSWMQLSIDHVLLKQSDGGNDEDNLVVACRSCNSITSRMKFPPGTSRTEILNQKRQKVAESRKAFYADWIKSVAPRHLTRPLADLK